MVRRRLKIRRGTTIKRRRETVVTTEMIFVMRSISLAGIPTKATEDLVFLNQIRFVSILHIMKVGGATHVAALTKSHSY